MKVSNKYKHTNYEYSILERQFADGQTRFFIKIKGSLSQGFPIEIDEILNEEFSSYDEAFSHINDLKRGEEMITIIKEIEHTV